MFAVAVSAVNATPVWLLAPFALLLLSIAMGPIAFPHFWHRRYPLVAVGLGLVSVGFYLLHDAAPLVHAADEYLGFIALIG